MIKIWGVWNYSHPHSFANSLRVFFSFDIYIEQFYGAFGTFVGMYPLLEVNRLTLSNYIKSRRLLIQEV